MTKVKVKYNDAKRSEILETLKKFTRYSPGYNAAVLQLAERFNTVPHAINRCFYWAALNSGIIKPGETKKATPKVKGSTITPSNAKAVISPAMKKGYLTVNVTKITFDKGRMIFEFQKD